MIRNLYHLHDLSNISKSMCDVTRDNILVLNTCVLVRNHPKRMSGVDSKGRS